MHGGYYWTVSEDCALYWGGERGKLEFKQLYLGHLVKLPSDLQQSLLYLVKIIWYEISGRSDFLIKVLYIVLISIFGSVKDLTFICKDMLPLLVLLWPLLFVTNSLYSSACVFHLVHVLKSRI